MAVLTPEGWMVHDPEGRRLRRTVGSLLSQVVTQPRFHSPIYLLRLHSEAKFQHGCKKTWMLNASNNPYNVEI